jgi:ABC-type Fe3+ transport system permease subunit
MYAGFGCRGANDERGRLIVTTVFFGVLVVLLAVVLAVAGLAVVQRLVPLPIREAHNAATGVIYAALYVMFGVTLGFSLLLVWQQYDAAEKMTETEAAHVEELYQLAEGFPDPERGEIQEIIVSYARVVVEEEWPLMHERRTSPRAA